MAEYTLRIRRYEPEKGEAPYWQDYTVDVEGHRSVLDGILQVKDREDGSIGIRCSCQAAICGSCGVRVNGRARLACNTKLADAADDPRADGEIGVAPMDQIMRLRRRATQDFEINDQNNGKRHEEAFTNIIRKKGILDERKLL